MQELSPIRFLDTDTTAQRVRSARLCIAIGVMDGVHLGHQALVNRAVTLASTLNGTAAVLTFDPHPSAVLAPNRAPQLLGTLDERVASLHRYGAQEVLVLRFDKALAAQTPDEFVADVLVAKLGAAAVVVGDDFRFGCDRRGNASLLRERGDQFGFAVETVESVSVGGVPARSSVIRRCLLDGNVAQASHLLGRPYMLSGPVVRGKQIGRTIGFPTANVDSSPGVLVPGAGVYAGYATVDGETWRCAVSVGNNPTIADDNARTVEAYLMDGFDRDIYDRTIQIEFVQRLRGMEKFDGLPALVAQMHADVADVAHIVPLPR